MGHKLKLLFYTHHSIKMGNNNSNSAISRLPERKVEDWPESEYMAKDLNVMYNVINEMELWEHLDQVDQYPDAVKQGHSPESLALCLKVMKYIHKKGWDTYVKKSLKEPRPESRW